MNSELANMSCQGKGYFSPPRGKEKWARPDPPKEEGPLPPGRGNLSPWDFRCGKEVTLGEEREMREIETTQ